MSIDARVESVIHNEDGSGELRLIGRPSSRPDGIPGIAGVKALHFDRAPHEVTALNGLDIWGGAPGIMLGDTEIAKRESYCSIVFHDDETFKAAVRDYSQPSA